MKFKTERALLKLKAAASIAAFEKSIKQPKKPLNGPLQSSYFRKLAERNLRQAKQRKIDRAAVCACGETVGVDSRTV